MLDPICASWSGAEHVWVLGEQAAQCCLLVGCQLLTRRQIIYKRRARTCTTRCAGLGGSRAAMPLTLRVGLCVAAYHHYCKKNLTV